MPLNTNFLERFLWYSFENDTGETIPPFACLFAEKLVRQDVDRPNLIVRKPDAYRWPHLAFTGPWEVAPNKLGSATFDLPALAQIGDKVGNDQGNVVGPVDGEWHLANVSEGLTILPTDDIESDEVMLARPSTDDWIIGVVANGSTITKASPGQVQVLLEQPGGADPLATTRTETVEMGYPGWDDTTEIEAGRRVAFKYQDRWDRYVLWWASCPPEEP